MASLSEEIKAQIFDCLSSNTGLSSRDCAAKFHTTKSAVQNVMKEYKYGYDASRLMWLPLNEVTQFKKATRGEKFVSERSNNKEQIFEKKEEVNYASFKILLDEALEPIDNRLDKLDEDLEPINDRLDKIDDRLDKLENIRNKISKDIFDEGMDSTFVENYKKVKQRKFELPNEESTTYVFSARIPKYYITNFMSFVKETKIAGQSISTSDAVSTALETFLSLIKKI